MITSKKHAEFAICVANKGNDDLGIWKIYRILPDAKAAGLGCLRVVDESGEDYLYPADYFVLVDFPAVVRARINMQPPSTPAKTLRIAPKSSRSRNVVSR